ncbi:MAG: aryl-sulfate sulfotransferase [Candidatus Thorarchaeota archaeon]
MNGRNSKLRTSSAVLVLFIIILTLIPPNQTVPEAKTNSEMNHKDSDIVPTDSSTIAQKLSYPISITPDSFLGYNLFVLHERDFANGTSSNTILIMDMDGTVVAEKQIGVENNFDCPAEFIDPNTILVGTEQGAALWHLENDTLQYLGFKGHHEYEYNSNADTVFTFQTDIQNINGTDYKFDTIMEYDLNGSLVWYWNVSDFISKDWWCPYHDTSGTYRDITHSNTIFYDADEDIIYYNARNPNTFYKLNHSSKEVIWGLGEYGNFTLFDLQGEQQDNLFYHPHSIEPVDDDTFILFDNDYHNQTNELNRISRILEVTINETTMTANESWYYEAPSVYYCAGWGDADRLPNGNRLGTWGYPSTPTGGPSASLIEVSSNHEVVWQLNFTYTPSYSSGTYRMERFRYQPIISSPEDIIGDNSSYTMSWNVWYNFRNKHTLPGNYTLFIDGVQDRTGLFNYSKYWLPTAISIDTGTLSPGPHNITLEIDDGFGNKASDSVNVTVEFFQVHRTGRTTIEKGETEFLPTWSGFTSVELLYNITLDGVLYEEMNWTGQDIMLDPNLIDLGSHLVDFRLYRGPLLVHNETFWIQVTPMEPPIIIPHQPTDILYNWSQHLVLSWDLYDVTAHSWAILLEGIEIANGTWSPTNYTLNWEAPLLEIGTYNVTVVVGDDLGQVSISQCSLTVPVPSRPLLFSTPGNSTIIWGSEGISFVWEVVGGTQWMLYRNSELFAEGDVIDNVVEVLIDDWRTESWRPGLYNLTLIIMGDDSSTTDTIWTEIVVDPGDPYVDAILPDWSQSYFSGQNAIGSPDDLFATLFPDYEDGYLSLDMGENEEILDGQGDDFTVIAQGGFYRVYITNSLDIPFVFLGIGYHQESFDLSGSGLGEARYVRIQYYSGEDTQVDAIVAIDYAEPPSDNLSPVIEPIDDFWIWLSDNNTLLQWNASDDTPWSYEIYIDSLIIEDGAWYGANIEYSFIPDSVGLYNITLVLHDAFENTASDCVVIDVRLKQSGFSTLAFVAGVAVFSAAAILIFTLRYKQKIRGA